MRRAAAGVLALSLALLLMIPAFALPRLDGVDNGSEWRGATQIKLVSGETNSGVNFGLVKYLTDLETQRVFLCFMYIDPAITQDNAAAGVILTVEDAASILFTVSQPAESPDPYLYSVEGAIAVNEQHGVVCELCIGVKEGLPAELPVSVRFFDAQGVPSNRYAFLVETGAGQKQNSPAYGDSGRRRTKPSATKQPPRPQRRPCISGRARSIIPIPTITRPRSARPPRRRPKRQLPSAGQPRRKRQK